MIQQWWQRLRMRSKIQILTQSAAILILVPAQFLVLDQFRSQAVEAAREKSESVADGVINGYNMLMETGQIGREENRELFIRKMADTSGIDNLDFIRGEPVRQQFGEGLNPDRVLNDQEARVMDNGERSFRTFRNENGTWKMEAVVPFIADTNFRGTNCMQCHTQAEPGDIMGAGSMVIDLSPDQQQLAGINMALWGGQAAVQLTLFVVIWLIAGRVTQPAGRLAELMKRVSRDGDLTQRATIDNCDEIGHTGEAINDFIAHFQHIIGRVESDANQLLEAVDTIANTNTSVQEQTGQQRRQTEEAATAAEQIQGTITTIAENVRQTNELVANVATQTDTGQQAMDQATEEMEQVSRFMQEATTVVQRLGEHSGQVGNMVSEIKDIADQTNLLALNAAIEAARAGQEGRGFAVVADEVRALSHRTSNATDEITHLTHTMREQTAQAEQQMQEATEQTARGAEYNRNASAAFQQIREGTSRSSSEIQSIDQGMNEQVGATQHIAETVQAIRDMTESIDRTITSTGDEASRLQGMARQLRSEIARFKTERD